MSRALNDVRPPDHLLAGVEVAGNGELFWPRDSAGEAARWLASLGMAIIGGENYRRFPGFWATYIGEWVTTPPWSPSETWAAYVERGLAQALDHVAAGGPSDLFFFAHIGPEECGSGVAMQGGKQAGPDGDL